MEKLSREQLEKLVSDLVDLALVVADAQTVENYMRMSGYGDKELSAIGFDTEVA